MMISQLQAKIVGLLLILLTGSAMGGTGISASSGCASLSNTAWKGTIVSNGNQTIPIVLLIHNVNNQHYQHSMVGMINSQQYSGVCIDELFNQTIKAIQYVLIKSNNNNLFIDYGGFNNRQYPSILKDPVGNIGEHQIQSGQLNKID